MYVLRDNSRNGEAVTSGTDRGRLDAVAAMDPNLEVWIDHGASQYYCHFRPQGMNWVHPYDLGV